MQLKETKKNTGYAKKQRSYKFYLFIAIFLIALLIIVSSITAGYLYSERMIRDQAEFSQNEVCERIIYDMDLINKGLEMYDMSLNNRVETDFKYFMDEYEKSGRNPDLMNLESAAEKTGDDITLYIINESYVITHSTNTESVGLDFKIYADYYTDYLENIRLSDGFFPERVVTEVETGLQKKFGYMPTPDNKYILEISLYDESFNNLRKKLKYSDNIRGIAEISPYIKDVRIFDTMKSEVGNSSFRADEEFSALLDDIFNSEAGRDIKDPESKETLRYLYVPLKSSQYGSDNSLIVELVLDSNPVNSMIAAIILEYLLIGLFSIGLCIGCAVIISRYFSREIEDIIDDISIISEGDYTHKIKKSHAREFQTLEESINHMVGNIRENIEKYRESQSVLKMERDRAQTYFSIADVIFIASDKNGIIEEINKKSVEVLKYTEEEIVGKNFFEILFNDDNREIIKTLYYDKLESEIEKPLNFRCKVKTKTEKLRDVNLSIAFLKNNDGSIKGWITTGSDITDDLKLKRELESSLNEKNALLREVHHRVKNNLQVIISLFELKSYCTDDKNLLKFINESKSRVNAIALVHDIMYRSDNFARVNLSEYTHNIITESLACLKPGADLSVDYDMDDIYFDLDNSVPYGILINELVSNSINHAFKGREKGKISVKLKISNDNRVILTFSDNGTGLPADDILRQKKTIGFSLITNLVRQLSGEMRIIRENGTTFIIDLEKPMEQIRF